MRLLIQVTFDGLLRGRTIVRFLFVVVQLFLAILSIMTVRPSLCQVWRTAPIATTIGWNPSILLMRQIRGLWVLFPRNRLSDVPLWWSIVMNRKRPFGKAGKPPEHFCRYDHRTPVYHLLRSHPMVSEASSL